MATHACGILEITLLFQTGFWPPFWIRGLQHRAAGYPAAGDPHHVVHPLPEDCEGPGQEEKGPPGGAFRPEQQLATQPSRLFHPESSNR